MNTVAFDLSDPPTTTDLKVEHRTNHKSAEIQAVALDLALFMCNAHGMPYTKNRDQKLTSLLPVWQMISGAARRKPYGVAVTVKVKGIMRNAKH